MTFFSATGATTSWAAEEDCVLVAATAFGAVALISLEPDLTVANWGGALTDEPQTQFRIAINSGTSAPRLENLSFEFLKGQKIFVAFNSSGQLVQLFFETMADARIPITA